MSIVFIDGFDHYPTAQIGYKWDSQTTSGTLAVGSSYGRYGSQGLRITDIGAVGKVFVPANKLVLGFAFTVGSTMDTDQRILCAFTSIGSLQVELRITNSNQLQITRSGTAISGGVSTITLTPGVTYFCEFKVTFSSSISAGDVVCKISGVTAISLPGGSSVVGAGGTTANGIQLGHGARGLFATNYQVDFDDLYLLNGGGTANNDFIGDNRVEVLWPVAQASDTDFSHTGAADAASAINEHTCDFDTSYISSQTTGNKHTFTYGSLGTTPDTIAGLQMVFMARKDDAGTRVGAGLAKIGGTEYVGDNFGIADAYNLGRSVFETNPATSAAWTPTDVNSIEAGIKLVV